MMKSEPNCFHCNSTNVKSLGFSEFRSNNIEIEEIQCLDCGQRTKIPLQNEEKQLRDTMAFLESKGYTLNLDKVKKAIEMLSTNR